MTEVEGLRKSFGRIEAVKDVSFRAPNGAITGLLGPNGAGKSTTLRLVCGILRADSGTVRIDGRTAVGDPSLLQERIGAPLDARMGGRYD
jgi:sodium transport system ATP-binding protein